MVEKLYEQFYQELVNWCRNMTGNQHTAEEVVQEAFLRAMLHEDLLSSMQMQQCRSWLYRTTKNLYVDRVRHNGKEAIVDEFPQQQIISDDMESVEWEELLAALPDMEGVIFAMRYLEGYNSSQIGKILSLPPGTVRFKLSSARQHLKEALGGKKYVQ